MDSPLESEREICASLELRQQTDWKSGQLEEMADFAPTVSLSAYLPGIGMRIVIRDEYDLLLLVHCWASCWCCVKSGHGRGRWRLGRLHSGAGLVRSV